LRTAASSSGWPGSEITAATSLHDSPRSTRRMS
jgi:hypothetical protein